MQLVPLFSPIETLCWNLWKLLASTCHEDVAKHAVRLVTSGFWCDLITEALSHRWEIAQIDDRPCLILQSHIGRDLYKAFEGEEYNWLPVQYRGETLHISSLFYDTRGQVLRTTWKKAVKSGTLAAQSDAAHALYTSAFVLFLWFSAELIPCDTQYASLYSYRLAIHYLLKGLIFLVRFLMLPLGDIPLRTALAC